MTGPGWILRRVLGIEPALAILHSLRPPAGAGRNALDQAWTACKVLGALLPGCNRSLGPLHLGGLILALAAISVPITLGACQVRGRVERRAVRELGGVKLPQGRSPVDTVTR
jgi:hypothetical protein